MKFPSDKKIKEMSEKLSRGPASFVLPKNSSSSDKIKYYMCKDFAKYCIEKRITQKDLADKLSIDPARVNAIVNYRIEQFTLDRILSYYTLLFPKKIDKILKAVS